MTTDELRAKFEAHFSQPPYEWEFVRLSQTSAWPDMYSPYYIECAWLAWQAAHASRDVEVEALRKDAKRWHAVRSCAGNVGVYGGTPTYDPGVELLLDEEADQTIDDAMREKSK